MVYLITAAYHYMNRHFILSETISQALIPLNSWFNPKCLTSSSLGAPHFRRCATSKRRLVNSYSAVIVDLICRQSFMFRYLQDIHTKFELPCLTKSGYYSLYNMQRSKYLNMSVGTSREFIVVYLA